MPFAPRLRQAPRNLTMLGCSDIFYSKQVLWSSLKMMSVWIPFLFGKHKNKNSILASPRYNNLASPIEFGPSPLFPAQGTPNKLRAIFKRISTSHRAFLVHGVLHCFVHTKHSRGKFALVQIKWALVQFRDESSIAKWLKSSWSQFYWSVTCVL